MDYRTADNPTPFSNYGKPTKDEIITELRAEVARLDAALADTAAQLVDALERVKEAEHQLQLMTKQANTLHGKNARLREMVRKARINTVARRYKVYEGKDVIECKSDGGGPGCENEAVWEIQAMDASGSHYTYVCNAHLGDYQKWAHKDGRSPMVFEVDAALAEKATQLIDAVHRAREAEQQLVKVRTEIRSAVANYMQSERCSCCRDIDAHEKHKANLARLLDVPVYDDNSGFNFNIFVIDA